ncbi:MAG: VWA domain-containing protein [Acidobacteriota bacterium]
MQVSVGYLLAFSLTLPVVGLAQEQTAPQETLKVDTVLVPLTATVFDAKDRYVTNLKKDDFAIFENDVRQEISFFSSDEQTPVSIGILFDTSGSMIDKLDGVQDAVKHFIDKTRPGDEIFLIRFGSHVKLVCDFTDDRKRLYKKIESLEARGSTALYDALNEGLEKVKEGKHRKKAILLITDGNDTSSDIGYREALEMVKKSEVLVYCLGIGHGERGSFGHLFDIEKDTVDIQVLRAFSDASGGRSYLLEGEHHAGGVDCIDEAILESARELRQQYSLGYYPTNRAKDGTYRTIKIRTTNTAYTVRARKGYWAEVSAAVRESPEKGGSNELGALANDRDSVIGASAHGGG